MPEIPKKPVRIEWDAPASSVPLADLLACKAEAEKYGIPIDHPDAFGSVAELLDAEGNRSGILVRIRP
jgi:hypothetical protein